MQKAIKINRKEWENLLIRLSDAGEKLYAPLRSDGIFDYRPIQKENIGDMVYNEARPVSPLKIFFLPLRLNVSGQEKIPARTIIIGAPSCDIEGLKLLDAIYIDEDYTDETYLLRRQNTIIIGAACHKTAENCHCTSYGVDPWPGTGSDMSMSMLDGNIILSAISEKGGEFLKEINKLVNAGEPGDEDMAGMTALHQSAAAQISGVNDGLPGSSDTGTLVREAEADFWKKQSSACVSCGACSAICPTCTCFLLIDRPGFEKIKQQDTCQYPAFERVAGGEDPLRELSVRFHNRYMCKYVWKPERFEVLACTGCGRCIDTCIAGINKNEVIMDMT
ncbi:MAG: 4Fe-4S dicluster domain-containing protein [Bacteroidales bacterium]|nr:4Fe-4S dicluster domain-containing protein [Bacteroidales bacterium]